MKKKRISILRISLNSPPSGPDWNSIL